MDRMNLQSYLLAAAACAILLLPVITFLDPKRRALVLSRLGLQHRRGSNATTPPRSLTPEKSPPPDYGDAFPPARREALALVKERLSADQCSELDKASEAAERQPQRYAPLRSSWDDAAPDFLTPTGFSLAEIRAMGDFPNYAELSGVPEPAPYTDFDITKAKPRPFRPFRWAYHQTMSLTKMENDWWLELESSYADRIAQRKGLFSKHGTAVLNYLPGSEVACKELMEMSLQFLCARYPQHFSLSLDKTAFHNGLLKSQTNLKETHPLHVLLENVPEDFGIMLRDPDTGYYFLRAGVICSSLGWSLETKMGLQLHEIHAPIPDYKEKMQFSMDRFFSKMPTDKPIQRGSWGLEVDQPLFMPAGDPHEKWREVQSPELELDRCNLRVDWQTLRRLPLSASIIFNFKAVFTPVKEFRDEPYIPPLVTKVLHEGKKNLMEYKNTWHVEHVVLPAMEKWSREQVDKGIVDKDWEVKTLSESPFFPGWEEKWHTLQGF